MAAGALPFDETQCATFLVREEARVGMGGVLYVRDEEWAYVLPNAAAPFAPAFLEQLELAMDGDRNEHYFIVVERDSRLDVIKYPRAAAAQCVVRAMAASA